MSEIVIATDPTLSPEETVDVLKQALLQVLQQRDQAYDVLLAIHSSITANEIAHADPVGELALLIKKSIDEAYPKQEFYYSGLPEAHLDYDQYIHKRLVQEVADRAEEEKAAKPKLTLVH